MGKLINIIRQLNIPKVFLRHIMMNFLDLASIDNLLFTVKEMNVLDDYSKDLIIKANNGFIWNCANGYLTVAKWLLELGTTCSHPTCSSGTRDYSETEINRVDIHAENERAFRWACKNGHLNVAKWLLALGTMDEQRSINIHADDECAFKWYCENGHLIVAKWLLELGTTCCHPTCLSGTICSLDGQSGINIHADNEYAFKSACANGYWDWELVRNNAKSIFMLTMNMHLKVLVQMVI